MKKYLIKFSYFLTALFSLSSNILATENSRVIKGHASEIPISSTYKKAIQEAGILMDAVVDQEDDFWILSQKNLIRWSVDEGDFRFLNIENPGRRSHPRTMTEVGNHQLLIGADSWFAVFNGENFDLTLLKYPWIQSTDKRRLLSLSGSSDNFAYIVHEEGILRYNQDEKIETLNFKNMSLLHSAYACVDTKARFIYQIQDKKLNLYDLSQNIKSLSDEATYLGVSCHSNSIAFVRSESFYDVWQFGLKKQRIQLEPTRKILAKDIQENFHSFLFDDGLVDVFDLKNKKHLQFQIQKPSSKIQKILTIPRRILIVEDKTLKAYQLSWLDR